MNARLVVHRSAVVLTAMAVSSAFALGVIAGPATADPPSGAGTPPPHAGAPEGKGPEDKGQAGENHGQPSASRGKSADAPGQEKKETAPDPAGSRSPGPGNSGGNPGNSGAAPGQAKNATPNPTSTPGQQDNGGWRGTTKIAWVEENTHPDNNPKPGCAWRIDFYGFNTGTYDVTISAQQPTGTGVLETGTKTITTAPTQGNSFQGSYRPNIADELAALPRQPKQGYHIKVSVTDASRQGNGGKQKVLWTDCTPTPPTSPPPAPPTPPPPTRPPTVLPTRVNRPPAPPVQPPTRVKGVKVTRPVQGRPLPMTGATSGSLALAGLAILLSGVVVLTSTTRQTS